VIGVQSSDSRLLQNGMVFGAKLHHVVTTDMDPLTTQEDRDSVCPRLECDELSISPRIKVFE
jgi:hypothetical protein